MDDLDDLDERAGRRARRAVEQLRSQYADLNLDDEEFATMRWLEMWESCSIENIASVIAKARWAGQQEA